jgi:hypothetical protein
MQIREWCYTQNTKMQFGNVKRMQSLHRWDCNFGRSLVTGLVQVHSMSLISKWIAPWQCKNQPKH